MTQRIFFCIACAATEADGAVFPPKPRGLPRRCLDCASGPAPAPLTLADGLTRNKPRTRASYRAAHRHRSRSAQLDLVDLLVPPP